MPKFAPRKYYKRRPRRRRRKPAGVKALALVRNLRRNVEHKFMNLDIGPFDTDVDGVWHLTACAEGDTSSQRTGLRVSPKSLTIKCMLTKLQTTDGAMESVRVMLVRDKQQVGDTSPPISAVLDGAGILAHPERYAQGRFSILYDKVFNMGLSDAANTDIPGLPSRRVFTIRKSWKSLQVVYNGNLSTDIQKNGLYLMVYSDASTTGAGTQLDFESRIRYEDL